MPVLVVVTRGDALALLALAPGYYIPRLWRCLIARRFVLPHWPPLALPHSAPFGAQCVDSDLLADVLSTTTAKEFSANDTAGNDRR